MSQRQSSPHVLWSHPLSQAPPFNVTSLLESEDFKGRPSWCLTRPLLSKDSASATFNWPTDRTSYKNSADRLKKKVGENSTKSRLVVFTKKTTMLETQFRKKKNIQLIKSFQKNLCKFCVSCNYINVRSWTPVIYRQMRPIFFFLLFKFCFCGL